MTELNATKPFLHDILGCVFAILAEMKTWLGRDVSMAPAI